MEKDKILQEKKRYKLWTLKEIEFLKENYDKIPTSEIAIKLNKSEKGIYHKCLKLNISSKRIIAKITQSQKIKELNLKFWKGKKQSKEHIRKRIERSKETFLKNHPKIKTKCDYCYSDMYIIPIKFKLHKRHFCNLFCCRNFRKENPEIYNTPERNRNVSLGRIGLKQSKEAKQKMSLAKKGKVIGDKNSNWKGGKSFVKGYIRVYSPTHLYSIKNYVLEHRLIAEQFLGRFLTKEEVIHHLDENKKNNKPENLLYFKTNGEHLSFHNKIRQFGFTNPIKREIELRKIINIIGMKLWTPI